MANASPSPEKVLPPPAKVEGNEVIIAGRRIGIGGPRPQLREGEKFVAYTTSPCPYCYRLLPAVIFERDGAIWIRKKCPEHGEMEEVYFEDAEMYYRFMKYEEEGKGVKPYVQLAAPCPFNCGLCPLHKNHTALANLVVTNRCNLSCWYCFFFSEAAGYVYEPSLEQIRFMVRQLKKQGVTMAIQITGGEPTLRDDLVDIVRLLKEEGVRHIQLNTQGIRIAEMYLKDPQLAIDYVAKLRSAGVNTVYLSFDGVSPRVNWKNHWEIPFIFDAFRKGGMTSVVLVPTVIKGINDHELGDIIRFAGKHIDIVRGVNYQPVSLTGMMKRHERLKLRITIPGAIKRIEEQTDGQIHKDAWYPIPVSTVFSKFIEALTHEPQFTMANHPACGAATYVFVERGENNVPKRFVPISDFLDVEGFVEYLKEKTEELEEGKNKYLVLSKMFVNMKKFIDSSKIPKDLGLTKMLFKVFVKRSYEALGELHYKMLFLGMMHFMDLYNYDVERVMRCNIHYLMPDGRIVPFCAFNVLNDIYRDYIQEKYKIPLDEWAKQHGEKSVGIASKYKRNRKLMESHPLYKETYKGIIF